MVNIMDIKYSQSTTLLSPSSALKGKDAGNEDVKDDIIRLTRTDILEISVQTDILEKAQNKKNNYADIEKKLGIDSSKWGVDKVSDDIFNFAKIMYQNFKLNHNGEENKAVLDKFYNMAKDSVTKGYEQAKSFFGGKLSDDASKLAEATFKRTIEKLDAWYKNGGVEPNEDMESVEETEEPAQEEKTEKSEEEKRIEEYENRVEQLKEMLKESETMKNQVLEMLKQQGIVFNESKDKRTLVDMKA